MEEIGKKGKREFQKALGVSREVSAGRLTAFSGMAVISDLVKSGFIGVIAVDASSDKVNLLSCAHLCLSKDFFI